MDGLRTAKRIKREPSEERSPPGVAESRPKPSASPAQEATRGRIASFEAQLRRLYRLRSCGKLDASKGAFQIRCLEEDLRKAHSKLRRLLNEAQRQRRRRERLRGGGSTPAAGAPTGGTTRPAEPSPPDDRSIMAALRGCDRFEDFVRELHSLGFSLARMNSSAAEYYEDPDSDVDGVKVQVELIEGEEPFRAADEQGPPPLLLDTDTDDSSEEEEQRADRHPAAGKCSSAEFCSYRDWFERQQEAQQRWEESFMREQMQLAKSTLEAVTASFLHGIQQVLQNVTAVRRFSAPFCQAPPFHHHQVAPSGSSSRRKK